MTEQSKIDLARAQHLAQGISDNITSDKPNQVQIANWSGRLSVLLDNIISREEAVEGDQAL